MTDWKRNWTVVLGLGMAWLPQALASKARLLSLSQDKMGSLLIDDRRNLILNPAFVSYRPHYGIFEWGDAGTNDIDTTTNPKAEGGYVSPIESFGSYGVYLGNEDDRIIAMRSTANGGFLRPDNTVDLIFGAQPGRGQAWGVSLGYSNNRQEAAENNKRTETSLILKGGARLRGIDLYMHLIPLDKAKGTGANANNNRYEGDIDLALGAGWAFLPAYRLHGSVALLGADFKPEAGDTVKIQDQSLDIGVGRLMRGRGNGATDETEGTIVPGQTLIFWDIALSYRKLKYGDASTKTTALPLSFGVERSITDWLNLKASVRQKVILNRQEINAANQTLISSDANSTEVAAGSGMVFQGLNFDSSFTTTGGTLNAGNIMSRVAMTYQF